MTKKAGLALSGLLLGLTILYVTYKLLTNRQTYVCPTCGHRVAFKSPYCWYCRIPLKWESPPRHHGSIISFAIAFVVILAAISLFIIYPLMDVKEVYIETTENVLLFFGGVLVRDILGAVSPKRQK